MRAFTFEIVEVKQDTHTMEVSYEAPGFDPVLVGMPLPLNGQALTDLVEQYAPHGVWDNVERLRAGTWLPEVGARGRVDMPSASLAATPVQGVVEAPVPEPEIVVRRVRL